MSFIMHKIIETERKLEEKALREVLERLARIETKLDNYESVRDKAEQALLLARANTKSIDNIHE